MRSRGAGDDVWVVCSPDIACVRVSVALGLGDHTVSLEGLIAAVGARARPALKRHFTNDWLARERTRALLAG
jgi:hypothetical protein